jgi:uncharacterized membrane protein
MVNALCFVCHRPSTVLASNARTTTVLAGTENEPAMQAKAKDIARFCTVEFCTHLMELISDRAKLAHATKSLFCLCLIVGAIALAAEIGATALAESFGLLQLPYALVLLDRHLPGVFRLHMAASGLGLMLLPWALLLRQRRVAHRAVGHAAAWLLIIGVVASLPSAVMSEASALARAGFFAQGAICLALLVRAIAAIRQGQIDQHRRAMLSVGAILFGVVILRLALVALSDTPIRFDLAYGIIAWASWLVPLLLVHLLLSRSTRFSWHP